LFPAEGVWQAMRLPYNVFHAVGNWSTDCCLP
jgi:hypothetical protein